jgi:diguanylate cyclase (GGDEF)-like protein
VTTAHSNPDPQSAIGAVGSGTDLLPAPARRVIIVGPGDAAAPVALEQSLRTDASLELVRVPDAMDAIGELAFDAPLPEAPVVLVTDAGEPDGRCGSVADFIDACRRVDPRTLVLRVGVGATSAPGLPGSSLAYDAFLPASAGPRELALALRAHTRPTSERAPEIIVRPQRARPAPVPSPASTPSAPAPEHALADAALTETIVRGESVLAPALALIGARLGVPAGVVTFRPAAEGHPAPGSAGVPVVLARTPAGAAPSGWLVAARGSPVVPAALAPHALWLASWLRLDAQQRDLRAAAFTDHLTGAWNRRYFERYLAACVAQARHGRLPVTVMLFDIDDFKKYNDRYGHGAGDEILIETVRLLRSVIRPTDRVCRIGGDEFAVVFFEPAGPRTPSSRPPESISRLAARFQKQICEHRFPKLGERAQGTLTISGGLATYPWDGATPEDLVRKADELSMQSKKHGKNALTFGPGAERACRTQS